jgi:hypothetical protein
VVAQSKVSVGVDHNVELPSLSRGRTDGGSATAVPSLIFQGCAPFALGGSLLDGTGDSMCFLRGKFDFKTGLWDTEYDGHSNGPSLAQRKPSIVTQISPQSSHMLSPLSTPRSLQN